MKYLLVVALICAFVSATFACDRMIIDHDIIREVNSNPKATWTAGVNKNFEGKTLQEIKGLFGAVLTDPLTKPPMFKKTTEEVSAEDLPESFDARTQWPSCIHPIRNQAQCGSCWAFSASEALSDRFCIASGGKTNVVLSPQDMVSCDTTDYGCQGGYLTHAWTYLEKTGIVSDKCSPYKSGGGYVPSCPSSCAPGSGETYLKYKAKSGSTVQFSSAEEAQNSIMKNGPVQTGFKVYSDFMQYKSGVYQHVSGGFLGGHAVKPVGWGVDSKTGLKYWIVANSWGEDWGLNGFFWMKRGTNECDFESQMIAGEADV